MTDVPLRPGCVSRCPGCAHRHLDSEASQQQKQQWLARRLNPWSDRLAPMHAVAGEQRWGYRERVCLAAAEQQGRWCFGLVQRDELIPIPECPVHSDRVNRVIGILGPGLPAAAHFPLAYFVQTGRQLTLVLKTARRPLLTWLTDSLTAELAAAGIEGLWLHLHPAVGKKIFNKPGWQLVWGASSSVDEQGMRYGPTGFQQLIPALYRDAMETAAGFLAAGKEAMVIDLYCGHGSTLRQWRSAGADTIGVEFSGEAVQYARRNAPGVTVLRGKCSQRIPQLREWHCNRQQQPLLYANPPRTGLEAAVVDWIVEEYQPRRLAYLSCSAGTLARDLERLQQSGYRVDSITPYDFFPNTYHVETLACLVRTDSYPGHH